MGRGQLSCEFFFRSYWLRSCYIQVVTSEQKKLNLRFAKFKLVMPGCNRSQEEVVFAFGPRDLCVPQWGLWSMVGDSGARAGAESIQMTVCAAVQLGFLINPWSHRPIHQRKLKQGDRTSTCVGAGEPLALLIGVLFPSQLDSAI